MSRLFPRRRRILLLLLSVCSRLSRVQERLSVRFTPLVAALQPVSASAVGTGDAQLIEAAQLRLSSAAADFGCASAPVNVPLNFVFSKSGCAMASLALKTRHQIHPTNLSICGDVSNMYNDCDQPVDADGKPDPTGHGRETMFAWCRRRFPQLLPALRLVLATPSLLRLTREDGAVPLPGAVISLEELTEPDPDDPRLLRSCAGGVQGRALSTLVCVGAYHEEVCHKIQKSYPTALIVGMADDVTINATPATACAAYADKIDLQRTAIGLSENLKKAAAYSPQGNLGCVPAALPGSPHHRDEEGNLTGRLQCFKMVGSYHGDDYACSNMTDVRLRKKLEPLNRMDRARETEYITNVGQLKHNILRYAVAPVTHFTAQTTEPSVAHVPLHNACMRIRESWEAATGAAASPQLLRDQAWTQACLPSEGYGGFNLMPATCLLDVHGNPFSHNYTATFLACWPQLRVLLPDLHGVDPTAADAPRFAKEAVAGYVELRRRREVSAAIHSRVDKHFTQRGGNKDPFHPPGLPEAESLPTPAVLFDPTSKSKAPSSGKLAMVNNCIVWHQLKADLDVRDEHTARNPTDGDSEVKHREASRLIAVCAPYAGAWHSVPLDGSQASKLATPQWQASVQRQLGLHLSAPKPALLELAELGETVDFFGDKACNTANHNRRHNGALRGWHDVIAAVATTQTVLGDKTNGAKTKQFNDFNDGHVVDIAEIGAGDSGEDVCNEVKVFAALKKGGSTGRGGADGGTSRKVGHKYLFGNTEDQCRIDNLGCAPRGRPTDGPFNHKTGKGYVKGKKGDYHDALFVKRNRVDLLLHEDLGGGFSPPAAHKIRRLGRKSREHEVDRTPYKGDRKISFVSYHTRAISMNIVRATAWTLHDAAQKAKGRLCGKRAGSPAALG